MCIQIVRRWRSMFIEGMGNVHNDEGKSWLAISEHVDVIDAMREVIDSTSSSRWTKLWLNCRQILKSDSPLFTILLLKDH